MGKGKIWLTYIVWKNPGIRDEMMLRWGKSSVFLNKKSKMANKEEAAWTNFNFSNKH